MKRPMVVLVMGVSGSGKTTIGEALALALGWEYLDADDFHPEANVAKMKAGVPLQDADRWPWLDAINRVLVGTQHEGKSVVLGCSALKESYRKRLASGLRDFRVVYLRGDFDLIEKRINARTHRYMPASLLKSQFETLEPPGQAIEIDVSAPVAESILKIQNNLQTKG
jgi:carbohydrate kinase (thermoresistant glucokinase family)